MLSKINVLAVSFLAFAGCTHAATVSYTFDVRGWIVDYQRPTNAPRVNPYDVTKDGKMEAVLANNLFPGPTIEATVGDVIEVTVVNNMIDSQIDINWDGVQVTKQPAGAIRQQGGQFKYQFKASKAGIFSWHSSLVEHAARGLKGAIIVVSPSDPFAGKYKARKQVALSDARQRPQVCFDAKGMLSPACPEIEKATLNGQWGDDSKGWPKPKVQVVKGQCYRMEFVGIVSQAAGYFKVAIKDHTIQVISGSSTSKVSEIEVHPGEGVDTIVCADQKPGLFGGSYAITYTFLTPHEQQAFDATLEYVKSEQAPLPQAGKMPSEKLVKQDADVPPPLGMTPFDPSECDKRFFFDLRDVVVDWLRPTVDLGGKAARLSPDKIPLANRKKALLVNDSFPGPLIEATEGELVCVTVNNNLVNEPVAIHWHGQHMKGFPAFDGVYGVTQGAINPGTSLTYRWRPNVGTHWWHAHMQALQADRGLKGPIVIHPKTDPHKALYDYEQVVTISDDWVDAGACLRAEGAQPGNPVCAEIDKAMWNGQWGDGSDEYPWPLVTVQKGKCYRLRFIGIMGQAQNFQIEIAGHNMSIIAVDGVDTVPTVVSKFNIHAGERIDVVLCANQDAGNYLITAVYDLATFLETAPAPHMPKVDSSKFWAFINYAGHNEKPGSATHKLLGGYKPPPGTGGGLNPKAVGGITWDTNLAGDWLKVKNLHPEPEPEKADIVYTMDVGITHPSFKAGVTPYAQSDKMYMFTNITSWKKPSTPLLHTKGTCGAEGVPFITVPDGVKTVEVRINNLSPTAHVLHMHGMNFKVINYADFGEKWCAPARFDCFFLPISVAKKLDCPGARLGDPNKDGPGSQYWGCPYDPAKDIKTQNLVDPMERDMISLFRRSWAVIRFKVENPGVWIFHCHMEQHIPTGQVMAFNLLPAQQPPIPSDVPSEGSCPVWSGRNAPVRHKDSSFFV